MRRCRCMRIPPPSAQEVSLVTGADSRCASACRQLYSPPGCWVGFIPRNAVMPDRSAGRPPQVTGASVTARYGPLLAPHRACLDPPLSGGVLAVLKVIRPGWPAARRAVRRLRGLARPPWPEVKVASGPALFVARRGQKQFCRASSTIICLMRLKKSPLDGWGAGARKLLDAAVPPVATLSR